MYDNMFAHSEKVLVTDQQFPKIASDPLHKENPITLVH